MTNGVEYILKARDLLSGVLRNAAKAAENVFQNVTKVGGNTEKAMRLSQKAVDVANRSWRSYIDNVRKSNNETNKLTDGIKRVAGAAALLAGVKTITKLGADLEASRINFEVLLGSAEKAKVMLDGINVFANATPYDNEGLIENAKMMLSFGTSAEKILPNLKMLGDIAMGDKNKMASLTLAFSQMSSAGRLMGQDLLQMINAGFNPLNEMSKMTGKNMATLKEEMEKGKISVQMVESAFRHATSEGGIFYGMMDKMSQTASGKLSTLLGSLKQTGAEIGLKLLPYVNRLLDFVMPLAGWIGRNADMIIQLTAVLLGAYGAFKLITFGIKMWTIAQAILNGVMMLNPIGLVIGAIAALIALVVVAWNKFAGFRGVVMGVWETFKLFTNFLKNAVLNTIKGIVDTFSGLGKVIQSIFKLDWDGIKEGAQQAASGYVRGFMGGGAVSAALDSGRKIGETWRNGYQKGAENFNSSRDGKQPGVNANSFFSGSEAQTTGGTGGGNSVDPRNKASSIAGGGSRPTNITVNVNKEMVGSITINPLTMSQGASEVKDIVMQALAQILNSTNRLATE